MNDVVAIRRRREDTSAGNVTAHRLEVGNGPVGLHWLHDPVLPTVAREQDRAKLWRCHDEPLAARGEDLGAERHRRAHRTMPRVSTGSTATKTRTVGGRLSTSAAPAARGVACPRRRRRRTRGVLHQSPVDTAHGYHPRAHAGSARRECSRGAAVPSAPDARDCRRLPPLQIQPPGAKGAPVDAVRARPLSRRLSRSLRRANAPPRLGLVRDPSSSCHRRPPWTRTCRLAARLSSRRR